MTFQGLFKQAVGAASGVLGTYRRYLAWDTQIDPGLEKPQASKPGELHSNMAQIGRRILTLRSPARPLQRDSPLGSVGRRVATMLHHQELWTATAIQLPKNRFEN